MGISASLKGFLWLQQQETVFEAAVLLFGLNGVDVTAGNQSSEVSKAGRFLAIKSQEALQNSYPATTGCMAHF